jgi:hypothetical protein
MAIDSGGSARAAFEPRAIKVYAKAAILPICSLRISASKYLKLARLHEPTFVGDLFLRLAAGFRSAAIALTVSSESPMTTT